MSLQDKLDAYHQESLAKRPAHIAEAMQRARAS